MYTICLQPMSNMLSGMGTTDRLSKNARSELMARVKSKDTKPEKAVRILLSKMGFRYRLHRTDLPGSPDIVFSSRRKVIFVHGCFWHGHNCKAGRNTPASNKQYWTAKLERNIKRDKSNRQSLAAIGWQTLIIWECKIKKTEYITELMNKYLNDK